MMSFWLKHWTVQDTDWVISLGNAFDKQYELYTTDDEHSALLHSLEKHIDLLSLFPHSKNLFIIYQHTCRATERGTSIIGFTMKTTGVVFPVVGRLAFRFNPPACFILHPLLFASDQYISNFQQPEPGKRFSVVSPSASVKNFSPMEPVSVTLLKDLNVNLLDYTIKDDDGTKVQGFVLGNICAAYEHLLKEKQCLVIRNPCLVENKVQKWKYVESGLKLSFNEKTTVTSFNGSVGSEYGFHFSPFGSFIDLFDEDDVPKVAVG
ncbi:hypothetical protein M8C21_013797 [Ambrosia artemisiifolia]|uniref:Uncharacterized protein n=1 Tax=Ambrosia artemisiifolia TaxID=4212 RepID=A0AAD5CMI1_AMBAR|nr:hypothetical protein M8C21_013797 [Ambrosia artemisiifolia]